MAYFEVQEYCLCGGWTNTWNDDKNATKFDSYEAARAELFEFLEDCEAEVIAGNMPDAPDYTDFRIVEVQHV